MSERRKSAPVLDHLPGQKPGENTSPKHRRMAPTEHPKPNRMPPSLGGSEAHRREGTENKTQKRTGNNHRVHGGPQRQLAKLFANQTTDELRSTPMPSGNIRVHERPSVVMSYDFIQPRNTPNTPNTSPKRKRADHSETGNRKPATGNCQLPPSTVPRKHPTASTVFCTSCTRST